MKTYKMTKRVPKQQETAYIQGFSDGSKSRQAEIAELKCELTILLKLSTVNMTDDHIKRVKKLLRE